MITKQWDADEDMRISPEKQPDLSQLIPLCSAETTALNAELVTAKKKKPKKKADDTQDFSFSSLPYGVDSTHHVAEGYRADILIRWGDPVTGDAPEFDPMGQTPQAQARQFGYNNDFVGFFPLPRGSYNPDRGLLAVNHEYTTRKLMFPEQPKEAGAKNDTDAKKLGKSAKNKQEHERQLCEIEMAAHGLSVIEIEKDRKGRWQCVRFSPYNRRISPLKDVLDLSGPAAGHERLKTEYDPKGRHVIGTLNNCAGGMTPWGTLLTAEENFNGYFCGKKKHHPEKEKLKRYGIPGKWFDWGKHHARFDIEQEPNEINRFGWIVELDPYDPHARPIKRTALGRFKHEGAAVVVNDDGRVVVYSADDQAGEYLYKFVTHGRYDPHSRRANFDLLDEGTLYVARFEEGSTLNWLPLRYGYGPLTKNNGFDSQADVVIDARLAADTLGATPLNRPEDVTVNPKTNTVYLMLLGDSPDSDKTPQEGQILQLTPPLGDHASEHYSWDIMLHASTPKEGKADDNWFIAPDNFAVDGRGRLWVTTDQGDDWGKTGSTDGIWAVETHGKKRGAARMFFRVPVGAEMASPAFTPDDKTLFVSVQHPGSDGAKDYPPFARESTFSDPVTRWPDFKPDMPPRPSLMVITKKDGGIVGS
ncbi:PhoX family protein [Oceanospirillum maris]|uniref:PhoX family protein n=1 Tax=Oceanospirillum maris TaxID=64977 RepID=UPI0003FE78C2|nr:PhoX family phosphatase [Oceanospirillum maris]